MIHGTKNIAVMLSATLCEGQTDQYPQVKIYDVTDALVATVNLSSVASGLYRGTWTPTINGFYHGIGIVYTVTWGNTESTLYGRRGVLIKVDEVDTNIDDIETDTNELQGDWHDGGRLDLILDARAADSGVETHVTNSLNAYDPPTRAELTTDTNSIIAEVNANETKIDLIQTDVTFIKDIEQGRWIRDGSQMKFYKSDNVTLVATFDLKKSDGTPAGESDDAFERVAV